MLSQRGGAADSGEGHPLRALTSLAKREHFFLTKEQIESLGTCVSKRSGESAVYWSRSQNAYYKVKSPFAKQSLKSTSLSDCLFEHIIHNILFPETAYEFIGLAEELHELRIVLKQSNVPSETFPTDEQIADHLQNILGLVPEDRYFFGNEVLAVTDVSSQSDNVLLGDDNRLYFIDPLIRLKKPAPEVIEHLTGTTLLCA